MFNPMKVPCPKCNSKGHKSEGKIKYIWGDDKGSCRFCLGTRYVDWIELATGGKRLSSLSSSSTSSSRSSTDIKSTPSRRKDIYVQNQKNIQRFCRSLSLKTQRLMQKFSWPQS